MQVTEPLSREGSPHLPDDMITTQPEDGPDALATPPSETETSLDLEAEKTDRIGKV